MSRPLYLDTARLGLMSPSAQLVQHDFAKLSGDPHGLLYFSEFLRHGFSSLPKSIRDELPSLQSWQGLDELAASTRRLTQAPTEVETLFASRSVSLMKLAAEHVAIRCKRVVTVDLLWSPYRRVLVDACRRHKRPLLVCPLRNLALGQTAGSEDLATRLLHTYQRGRGEGLILPQVDHRGITLPVQEILSHLASIGERPRAVAIDGTQALGHLPAGLPSSGCDFFIGGTHKWIGSYHPLGVGVVSQEAARSLPKQQLLGDPMLRLTQELTGRLRSRHGETAAILPLLTAAAALDDLSRTGVRSRLASRLDNREILCNLLAACGRWKKIGCEDNTTGIVLARPSKRVRFEDGINSRQALASCGVVATSYRNQTIRFSLPAKPFTPDERQQLRSALDYLDRSQPATGPIPRPCPLADDSKAFAPLATRLTPRLPAALPGSATTKP